MKEMFVLGDKCFCSKCHINLKSGTHGYCQECRDKKRLQSVKASFFTYKPNLKLTANL